IALFFLDRLTTSGFWGNIVALASALAFASLVILLRKERSGSPINIVILGNIIVGIAGAPFLLRAPLLQPRALWLVLVLGVLQLGLSYALYAEAIKHVTALEAMLIPLIEPILNPVWVMLALGVKRSPSTRLWFSNSCTQRAFKSSTSMGLWSHARQQAEMENTEGRFSLKLLCSLPMKKRRGFSSVGRYND